MPTKILRTVDDRDRYVMLLRGLDLPLTVSHVKGADRTKEQNNLSHEWYTQAATQFGDREMLDVKAWAKLHFGVAIMKENADFADVYDRLIKPMSYEDKLLLMKSPLMPVTSLMSTHQMTRYLDAVYADLTRQGIVLTLPERE